LRDGFYLCLPWEVGEAVCVVAPADLLTCYTFNMRCGWQPVQRTPR